jgi:hypothetical protein
MTSPYTPRAGEPYASDAQLSRIERILSDNDLHFGTPEGDFERLWKMLEAARIDVGQASRIIDWLQGKGYWPARAQAQGAGREAAPLPDVPEGHYATGSRTGSNDLDFWRVDRPAEGRWEGWTFVKRIIGGRPDSRVRGAEARAALEAIAAAGIEQARTRYGQEIGSCWKCNRHLTDDLSRELGIGPDCCEEVHGMTQEQRRAGLLAAMEA